MPRAFPGGPAAGTRGAGPGGAEPGARGSGAGRGEVGGAGRARPAGPGPSASRAAGVGGAEGSRCRATGRRQSAVAAPGLMGGVAAARALSVAAVGRASAGCGGLRKPPRPAVCPRERSTGEGPRLPASGRASSLCVAPRDAAKSLLGLGR